MKKYFYLLVIVVLIALGTQSAQAQALPAAVELEGFAWSSTIGWISLNCKTGGTSGNDICGSSSYRVTIGTNRLMTGWGWSSNVGWVKFGGLSAFPPGSGTQGVNAQVVGTYPDLIMVGWARACAGTNGGECATMANNPLAGGWDGWISLGGTTHTVSADMTIGMHDDSYAWGSDVVGWVDMFSHVTFVPGTTTATTTPGTTLSGTGCTIAEGASTCTGRLTWTIADTAATPNVYKTTAPTEQFNTRSDTNVATTLRYGTSTIQARDNTTVIRTVRLNASCATGLRYISGTCIDPTTVVVDTPPTIDTFKAVPPIVRSGNTSSIVWKLTDAADSTCVINGGGLVNYVASSPSNVVPDSSVRTLALKNTSTVTMTCTGTYPDPVTASTVIEVIPVAEEV